MQPAVILTPSDLDKFATDVATLVLKEVHKIRSIEKPLTKEGAAKYLSISEGTLDERFRTGKLPARLRYTNGGTIYFFASELEEFLKTSKRK